MPKYPTIFPDTVTDSLNFGGKIYGTGKVRAPGRGLAERARNLKMHMRGQALEESIQKGKGMARNLSIGTEPAQKVVDLGSKTVEPLKQTASKVRQTTLHSKGLAAEAAAKSEFNIKSFDPRKAGNIKVKGQFLTHRARELNRASTPAVAPKPAEITPKPSAKVDAFNVKAEKLKDVRRLPDPKASRAAADAGGSVASKARAIAKVKGAAVSSEAPSLLSRAGAKATKIGKGVANFTNPIKAMKEAPLVAAESAAKGAAAKWYNPAAKLAGKIGGSVMLRRAAAIASPIAEIDTVVSLGTKTWEAGKAHLGAELAGEQFAAEAKQYRKRGIKTTMRQSPRLLDFIDPRESAGDPNIEVSVPNPKAAMKVAAKKIPPMRDRIKFK